MRTVADRIRHAVSFELIGFLIVVSMGLLLFDLSLQDIGVVAIAGSIIATLWVYVFNYLFDRVLMRFQGHARKSFRQRLLNSLLFEIGLLLVLLPFIAWYLQVSLLEAFILDAALALFYLVYSLGFNWAYDLVFPIEPQAARH
ncbi:PACE efflux transporter [Granulosicoccus sp. 3-233]|uniref:PACE efflux transporter n=1 Tax=Granulosicoccus sp. 3-233 TaxID=3417969 RepID=UPI003D34C119